MLRSRSRKFWKGRSRESKSEILESRSRIFYLRLRNPDYILPPTPEPWLQHTRPTQCTPISSDYAKKLFRVSHSSYLTKIRYSERGHQSDSVFIAKLLHRCCRKKSNTVVVFHFRGNFVSVKRPNNFLKPTNLWWDQKRPYKFFLANQLEMWPDFWNLA